MSKTWLTNDEVKQRRPIDDKQLFDKLVAEYRALTDERVLSDIRKASGVTQALIAELLELDQSRISRIESSKITSLQLATLIDYLRAIDGDISITITKDDRQYHLTNKPVAKAKKHVSKKAARKSTTRPAKKPTKRRAS